MREQKQRFGLGMGCAVGAFFLSGMVLAAGKPATPPPAFEAEVLPILKARCLKCHGDTVRLGGLDLRSPAQMLKGGEGGPAVAAHSPERSPLIQRVADRTMPPGNEKKLTDAEIGILRAWVAAGAPGTVAQGKDGAPAGKHWAFVPPTRPAVPQVRSRWWVRTPIDAFVAADLERHKIPTPAAADRRTLLRRVTLDLIGLPPTPEEQAAFLADKSPNAWEKVMDGLLARPEYGERWGRHWLDVVRYAESNGYERDGTKPNAWRYRDYVIQSLNADKPYDRFLTEQLAGDELSGSNAETQIATTFLRLGTWDDEPAEPKVDRYDQLDDVLGTTATAFMGVTLRCARCHDHKFEPFSQKDYYRVLAAFQPLKRPQEARTDLDRLAGTEAELTAYHQAMKAVDDRVAPLERDLDTFDRPFWERLFTEQKVKLNATVVAAFRALPEARTKAQQKQVAENTERVAKELLTLLKPEEQTARNRLTDAIAQVNATRPPEPPRAYIWFEESTQAPPTRVLLRGNPENPVDEVQPGLPAVMVSRPTAPPVATAHTTGRRLWLANWLVSRENPLTARVMVNRIWQGHFGEGLVPSENDFGVMGQSPVNRPLLDWLAVEFRESGWSMKRLHRMILLSNTYKATSAWNARSAKLDSEGHLFWRWKPRRLEAEAIRDGILAVSGNLNSKSGGPSIYPVIPRAVLEGQSRPGDGWGKSDEREAARRSVYIFSKRSLIVPELEVLDAADTTSSCEQRPVSTIAPQALTFLNGDFIQTQSRQFAARLAREAEQPEAQVSRAFLLTVGRPSTPEETQAGMDFLATQERQIATEGGEEARRRALEAFALVLLNNNEFVYLP